MLKTRSSEILVAAGDTTMRSYLKQVLHANGYDVSTTRPMIFPVGRCGGRIGEPFE